MKNQNKAVDDDMKEAVQPVFEIHVRQWTSYRTSTITTIGLNRRQINRVSKLVKQIADELLGKETNP